MRKRSRKIGHRLYAATVIILGIAILVLTVVVFFYIQSITIEGNEYTKDEEILEVLQEDSWSVNSVYMMGKYLKKDYKMPKSLSSFQLKLTAPWAIKVTVKEKPIVGCVYEDEKYVYFDKEGLVVYKSSELQEGTPQVEGLEVTRTTRFKTLGCKDEKIFEAALKLVVELKNYELTPDRIVSKNDQLYLRFDKIHVALGTIVTADKTAQIKPILEKIGDQSGTVHLEYYENEGSTVTFKPGEYPTEN